MFSIRRRTLLKGFQTEIFQFNSAANNAFAKCRQDVGTSAAATLQVRFGAGQVILNFTLHSAYRFQFDITAQQILAMNSGTSQTQTVVRHPTDTPCNSKLTI